MLNAMDRFVRSARRNVKTLAVDQALLNAQHLQDERFLLFDVEAAALAQVQTQSNARLKSTPNNPASFDFLSVGGQDAGAEGNDKVLDVMFDDNVLNFRSPLFSPLDATCEESNAAQLKAPVRYIFFSSRCRDGSHQLVCSDVRAEHSEQIIEQLRHDGDPIGYMPSVLTGTIDCGYNCRDLQTNEEDSTHALALGKHGCILQNAPEVCVSPWQKDSEPPTILYLSLDLLDF